MATGGVTQRIAAHKYLSILVRRRGVARAKAMHAYLYRLPCGTRGTFGAAQSRSLSSREPPGCGRAAAPKPNRPTVLRGTSVKKAEPAAPRLPVASIVAPEVKARARVGALRAALPARPAAPAAWRPAVLAPPAAKPRRAARPRRVARHRPRAGSAQRGRASHRRRGFDHGRSQSDGRRAGYRWKHGHRGHVERNARQHTHEQQLRAVVDGRLAGPRSCVRDCLRRGRTLRLVRTRR